MIQAGTTLIKEFIPSLPDSFWNTYNLRLETQKKHRHILQYNQVAKLLPQVSCESVLDQDFIQIGAAHQLTNVEQTALETIVHTFKYWRKGPFCLFGIEIDAEWRSDQKWKRLSPILNEVLPGKRVLDIGCNSGYFMFRMVPYNPVFVLGIDPMALYHYQFSLLQYYIQAPQLCFLQLGIENLDVFSHTFDTVFCMGILYHRRDPIQALNTLKRLISHDGSVILETLIIPGSGVECLIPSGRYAQMRNVFSVPTESQLIEWIRISGFQVDDVLSVTQTTNSEQRQTTLSTAHSLINCLDPNNPNLTIEGYPAPTRIMIQASLKKD